METDLIKTKTDSLSVSQQALLIAFQKEKRETIIIIQIRILRLSLQRSFVGFQSFLDPSQAAQSIPSGAIDRQVIWFQLERQFIGIQRFGITLQRIQHIASSIVGRRI